MPSSYRAETPYSELLVSHNPSSRICSRTYKLGPNFAEFLKNSTARRFEERAGPVRAMMARSFDLDDASREEHTASRHRDDAELPSFDFTRILCASDMSLHKFGKSFTNCRPLDNSPSHPTHVRRASLI